MTAMKTAESALLPFFFLLALATGATCSLGMQKCSPCNRRPAITRKDTVIRFTFPGRK